MSAARTRAMTTTALLPETSGWQAVHRFWFPPSLDDVDLETYRRMIAWWMFGGANKELSAFRTVVEAAKADRLNRWLVDPAGRLSLIIVLDQFTRGLFAGTPDAFASDPAALRMAEDGLRNGHFDAVGKLWEKFFFLLPLVHAEGPGHLERILRVVALWQGLAGDVPLHLMPIHRAHLDRAREHLDVISRFGRFPHRNAILGRPSTPEEATYVARGDFVHTRPAGSPGT
jgi:uncharacterized protein (DUF924 family)